MKLQKETLCLQEFIVKRSFILNSIASETGQNGPVSAQVLQLTVFENKTLKFDKHATYFTHEGSCKKKHFVCKHSLRRVFI